MKSRRLRNNDLLCLKIVAVMMDDSGNSKNPGIQKLAFSNGIQVGITGLDRIISDVMSLELPDEESIKTELLERVKAENYIAAGAEQQYASALLKRYRRKSGHSDQRYEKEPKNRHAG